MHEARRGTRTLQSLQNPLHSAGAAATAHRNVELVLVVRHGWSGRKKRIGDPTAGQRGEVERKRRKAEGMTVDIQPSAPTTKERDRYVYEYVVDAPYRCPDSGWPSLTLSHFCHWVWCFFLAMVDQYTALKSSRSSFLLQFAVLLGLSCSKLPSFRLSHGYIVHRGLAAGRRQLRHRMVRLATPSPYHRRDRSRRQR